MRLFEAEVGQGPQRSQPPFTPHSLRPGHGGGGQVPPPPSFPPRPQPLVKNFAGVQKEYSAPAVISKPDNDNDVFSTLLKYEKEVRQEKREKKKEAKLGIVNKPSKEKRAAEAMYKTATIAAPPVKPSSNSVNPMLPAALMKPSHISAQPTVTPVVKPGTQVTPDEIKLKAKQMVELVKASQVIQTKKLPPTQGTSKPPSSEGSGKTKKPKKMIRVAGGQVWEDSSLLNWDHNDFRLFCGDLGNDVTDEVLTRTFSRYPSFQKARVVRDKRSNKSKGYGFVSFKDPADFTRAIKELNGKYVGSRPIKLSKSNWKDRNIDLVKTKQQVKKQMGYKY